MKPYQIPCGKKTIALQIPDGIPVEWVESRKMLPVPDVRRAVEEALNRPIGTPRLRDIVKLGQTMTSLRRIQRWGKEHFRRGGG